jgi:hypothetical protein
VPVLKPHDVAIVLEVCRHEKRPGYAEIAQALVISASEAHAGVKRAHAALLLHGPEMDYRPVRRAVEEFVLHGQQAGLRRRLCDRAAHHRLHGGECPTLDVDVIVEITSDAEYTTSFARQLQRAGFREDANEAGGIERRWKRRRPATALSARCRAIWRRIRSARHGRRSFRNGWHR